MNLRHITLEDIRTHLVREGDDVLKVDDLSFIVGEGKVAAQASVVREDAGKSRIEITDFEATNLRVEDLAGSSPPDKPFMSGTLQARAEKMWIVPGGQKSLLAGLNGEFQLSVVDGTLNRQRILASILSIMNLHKTLRPGFPDLKTKGLNFSSIEGNFLAHNGVLYTNDLVLNSDVVRIQGIGGFNLAERRFEEMDQVGGMLVMVQPFQSVDKVVSQLARVPFVELLTGKNPTLFSAYFKVSGSMDSPKVRPVEIRSLEGGLMDRLRKVLHKGLRLFLRPGTKDGAPSPSVAEEPER